MTYIINKKHPYTYFTFTHETKNLKLNHTMKLRTHTVTSRLGKRDEKKKRNKRIKGIKRVRGIKE